MSKVMVAMYMNRPIYEKVWTWLAPFKILS